MGVTWYPDGGQAAPPELPRRTGRPEGDGERPVPQLGGAGPGRVTPEILRKVLAALRDLR